ncbi:hypothetical protein Bhyg_12697 [Pseudolycoriella hygida]|uniref:Allorecognition 2 n=1 Tax=Pseudolycoriella hygida TaxID=35572 RepID=A0A9Q0MYV2_9DIPT|nr:hypothetical protein Bhyg_12697 [Pseudolycoriella hygida]
MKLLGAVFTILFINKICVGSKHAFGNRNADFIVKLYEKKLIDDSGNVVPKDYTLIYCFRGTIFQPILYMEIDVNKESTGIMKGSKGPQDYWNNIDDTYSNYDATIHIKNATNVTATLTIFTFDLPQYRKGLSRYSLTFVHVKNTTSVQKPFAQNTIGKRQKGDEFIYFESRNVTKISRFPSRVFEYVGSEYLTYVRFSFNSPTAIALINTTFVNENEFNAVVYDLNTEHFVANMSIYGIKAQTRPENFLGLI